MRFVSSLFLSIIAIVITFISISLIIFYSEYFRGKTFEQIEKLNFQNDVYEIAKKLVNCMGFEEQKIFYVNESVLNEFESKYKNLEPRCAISNYFDYNVKVIQFEKEIKNYPILFEQLGCGWAWIVNSGSGEMQSSISLVLASGIELRRHYTHHLKTGNPSRTAIDSEGNVWVGNRGDTYLVKIAFDKNKCKGKTSEDLNKNGKIDRNEIVDFNEDGCILLKVDLGCNNVRAVCIDKEDNVYAGCWDGKKLFKISKDGNIVNVWNLPGTPYGCVFGNDGNIYISTLSNMLIRLNPNTSEIKTFSVPFIYGIWRCYNADCIVFSTWTDNRVALFNTTTEKIQWIRYAGSGNRGVFVDSENNVYVVGSNSNTISKFDINGNHIKTVSTCRTPTGVSMDACGNLWVVCMDGFIYIFDKDLNLLNSFFIEGAHYQYSDFTGFLAKAQVPIKVEIEQKHLKINQREWNFGINDFGPKIDYEFQFSYPVIIKYNDTFFTQGVLIVNAKTGFLEKFYSFIDDLCNKNFDSFEVAKKFYFDYDVKVFKDKICSENVCKKLECKYDVQEKEFKKGENVVKIKIGNNELKFE